jgi:S1-C subfamily serine protease
MKKIGLIGTVIAAVLVIGAGSASASKSDVSALVDPAVVDVNTVLGYENGQAAGTGIVLTSTGEILTNNHVIRGATNVKVTDVGNGKTYPATVVGYDVANDIAVLQLKGASGLQTISLGSSASVKVGQSVTAIGNAGGVAGTPAVAPGTVTGLGKSITATDDDGTSEQLTQLIQTNAGLEPGDSGGPLVNSSGLVVGIDTAASSGYAFQYQSDQATQGYAIPIDRALSIAKQIVAGKAASATTHIGPSVLLGVSIPPTAREDSYGGFGYGYGYRSAPQPTTTGAVVEQVLQGSPAAKSGLAVGDVITAIGSAKVTTPTTLTNALLRYSPSNNVTVTYVDGNGATQHASVKLATGPAQ